MRAVLCLALWFVGCADRVDTPELPALVSVVPADGASTVSIAARVTAEIPRDKADDCRFSADNSSLTVTRDGAPVAGSLVYFVDGLRIDFTPSGMFDYASTYSVTV